MTYSTHITGSHEESGKLFQDYEIRGPSGIALSGKRAGTAKWEESERVALPHGREAAILKHVSDGFGAGAQNQIICTRCAEQVVYGHG